MLMFSLFVKPSELQRWDRYGCSYSRFLNKYYHKAHSLYALLQRHRVHLGQASPPAPQVATAEPSWCLVLLPFCCPGWCCVEAALPQCHQLQPGAGTHGLVLCHVSRVTTGLHGNVDGAPGWLWACFTVGNSHMAGKHRVLEDCGRKREKNQGRLNVDTDLHQCF